MALPRGAKRFVVASAYFVSIVLLGIGTYYAFFKAPETCSDAKQNQDEQGVDCGGVCTAVCEEKVTGENLQLTEVAFVPGGNGRYDVLGKVYNPNDVIGASSFTYMVELKDTAGKVIASRGGKSFILPQESKYVLVLNMESSVPPAAASVRVNETEWARFSGYQEKPAVNIYQKRYDKISSGAGFAEAYGLLSNESPYDFRSVIVKVILRDGEGKPLAFNMTEMRTVQSHEERDFRLVWPSAFPGTVEKVETEVDADVYHSDNFMRQYFPGGRFQEFTPPSAF